MKGGKLGAVTIVGMFILAGCAASNPSATLAPTNTSSPSTTSAPTIALTSTMTPVPLPGRIAFISWRDGNQEIYVMSADGSDQRRLTNSPEHDYSSVWSPDGSKLAFVTDYAAPQAGYCLPCNEEISIVNADGTGLIRLTDWHGWDNSPAWSPDGNQIAFVSYRDGNAEIYTINVDGSGLTRLTNTAGYDISPQWSPDGRRIVFESDRDNPNPDPMYCAPYCNSEIYVMDSDGSNQTRLTNSSDEDTNPLWLPNGSRIAFTSISYDTPAVVASMNADGSNRVIAVPHFIDLVWSPDGSRIAYVMGHDIYVANADGGDSKNLTNSSEHDDFHPVWSPDGKWLAFVSERGNSGDHQVYVISAGGEIEVRLTDDSDNLDPVWSPVP